MSTSEHVLQADQAVSRNFRLTGNHIISLESLGQVQLLDDQALSAAFDIEIPSGRVAPLSCTVSAVVNGSSIVIVGEDIDGNSQTDTLSWSTGDPATMATTNSYREITSATPSGFSAETADVFLQSVAIAGSWVVQSARLNADLTNPNVWLNEFEVGDFLTPDIPMVIIPGSNTRVYRITGGTPGVNGFTDAAPTIVFR